MGANMHLLSYNAVDLANFVTSSEDTSNEAITLESTTATFGKQSVNDCYAMNIITTCSNSMQSQQTRVTGAAQSRLNYLVYLSVKYVSIF